eukprot:COSAG06_NODE_5597_length_3371_cov_1.941015_2_plen_174_part_00
MAPGCSVLRCFVVWASPMRLSPNNCDPQKSLGHARWRRLHRSDCLAHVEGPAPARGLKPPGRQALSQPWCPANSQARVEPSSSCERCASVATTSFFRSMICTLSFKQSRVPTTPPPQTRSASLFRFAYIACAPTRLPEPSIAGCVPGYMKKAMSATGPSPCSTFQGQKRRPGG